QGAARGAGPQDPAQRRAVGRHLPRGLRADRRRRQRPAPRRRRLAARRAADLQHDLRSAPLSRRARSLAHRSSGAAARLSHSADATMAAFGITSGAAPGSRIVPFDTSGTFPNPLPVAAAPAELLVYNPADHSATRTLLGGFTPGVYQAAAPFADGIAVAGGIDW